MFISCWAHGLIIIIGHAERGETLKTPKEFRRDPRECTGESLYQQAALVPDLVHLGG